MNNEKKCIWCGRPAIAAHLNFPALFACFLHAKDLEASRPKQKTTAILVKGKDQ
jgi:hypothetical protein